MRVDICGCRGSTPAPGPAFVRYGGHTSCVAVARDGEPPSLLLDVGTGARNVWRAMGGAPFRGSVLLGHLHWDHTQGLPFFGAGDNPDSRVDLYLPAQGHSDGDAEKVLAQGMSPPVFPIRPSQLRGTWRFHELEEGEHEIEDFSVLAREIPHKGGRTFGYRISAGGASMAYLSDHHPVSLGPGPTGFGAYHEAATTLVSGVDVLLHDAQYTEEEFATRAEFGHSTISYAVGLAEATGVKHLVLFHHDPARTDAELDKVVAELSNRDLEISAAVEGQVYDVRAAETRRAHG